jgi:hypothetical protein
MSQPGCKAMGIRIKSGSWFDEVKEAWPGGRAVIHNASSPPSRFFRREERN